MSHGSHGARSHVALWVLQQVFCQPQHLRGQETLPELLLVCKNKTAIQRSGILFPLSMKLFPMQTALCLIQGWPLPAGAAARERSCCRTRQMFCQAPPLPAAFSQALRDTGTWKIALRVVLTARKNFLQVRTWFQSHQIYAFA